MFVISLSPLAKIFQRHLQEDLMKDPERIYKPENFRIIAEKPSGDVHLIFGKPMQIAQRPGREKDEAVVDVINWLTGGPNGDLCRETDYTGVVAMPLDVDIIGSLATIVGVGLENPEAIEKEQKKQAKQVKTELTLAMEKAKAISETRVMRAIRATHDNLKKQYEINRQNGLGAYQPSTTEFLCCYALAAEQAKRSEDRKRITEQFAKLMDETRIAV